MESMKSRLMRIVAGQASQPRQLKNCVCLHFMGVLLIFTAAVTWGLWK